MRIRYVNVDYSIGDTVVSKTDGSKIVGICTGFRHDDTCIEINGKCYGGKSYFRKADFIDIAHEEVNTSLKHLR